MLLTMISAISGSLSTKDLSMSYTCQSTASHHGNDKTYVLVRLRECICPGCNGSHLELLDFNSTVCSEKDARPKQDGEQCL